MAIIEQRAGANNTASGSDLRDVILQFRKRLYPVVFDENTAVIGSIWNNGEDGGTVSVILADDDSNGGSGTPITLTLRQGANPVLVRRINTGGNISASDLLVGF